MAVDKNSKAYNSLRESGYTDEQIMKMHEEGLNGKSANEIINSSKQPERIDANVDQSKYDGTDGKGNITVGPRNANLNYYQYGDDSNPNQQGQKGGMNEKYTGEGVSNTYIEYNPDLTLADLDPNYLYGENARQQNRKEAGYIARRNDQIASALYNEGKVSREDVANFLSQQNEWMNSTEADRMNTIESVWKRLGQIKPEEYQPDLSKAEDIVKDTSGKIYGKTTAEEGNPKQGIDTLSDANSVFKKMQEKQVKDVQDFVSQDYRNIATCVVEGTPYWSEQTWRDAQKYYPDFISLVNEEVKRQRTQQNVTAIASGGEMTTSAANGQSSANTEIANFGASNATGTKSSVEITKDVHNALAQNQTANEASETMASIEEDMAILKNRLKNLRAEANSKFKGDAPDYLVNAYMNNKAQEIQNQMQILEDRYNAAYTRYKTELAQTQWEKEYELKKQQLQLEEKEFNLKKWATEQGVEIDWAKVNSSNSSDTSTKNEGDSFEVTTLSDEQVFQKVDDLLDMFDNGQLGNAQCAAGIQTYYLPMLGISLPSLSSLERKKALINEGEDYVPKKGDLIIINSGAKLEDGTPAGHIGIVLKVHDDGTVEYMDWNGKSNEKVAINGININSKSILGYRNVNKNQNSSSSNKEWEESDYKNFEKYLDPDTNQTTAKTIAMKYGFEDDYEGMTDFAREQLNIRDNNADSSVEVNTDGKATVNEQGRTVIKGEDGKEDIIYAEGVTANDPRLNQTGFDPVLGFNKYTPEFYEEVNKNPSKYTKQEQQEARNYADALETGEFGNKEDVEKKKTSYTRALLDNISNLYYLGMDDDGTLNFKGTAWYPNSPMNLKYNTIKSQMTLDEMLNAKANNVGFGQVTEYEWEMLRQASNSLGDSFLENDVDIDYEFKNKILPALWHDVMGQNDDFTEEKWRKYVSENNIPRKKSIGIADIPNTIKYVVNPLKLGKEIFSGNKDNNKTDFNFDALFDFDKL